MRRLGAARWQKLHRLTYPIAVLGAVHYLWLVKSWPLSPFLYLGAVLALLAAHLRRTGRPTAGLHGCLENDPLGVLAHEGALPLSLARAYDEMAPARAAAHSG